ncbi:MAG: polyamine aminopropyltransferase [Christensenella hongkongensis]|uniref:polyamine aminopropyltransferase n=1 Tax=Christensenella hongkongensis TaxID=270498 RepID=UPI0026741953|nr:polyamine aminopropyltransferase [Christensenella hongkongensis]MDY3004734.1 polyamine aminopropyltransferase [Christensenella hongkongensis]
MAKISKDNWFYEYFTDSAKFGIKIREHLIDTKSKFQKIDFYDSYEFGRFFTLDGFIMMTQRDEFIYHEMLVHVPMAVKPDVKRVLVIGGGDGGAVRELTRYKTIEKIDMVEIDEKVVSLCREYLPQTAGKLDDGRVTLHFCDGIAFVRDAKEQYDLVLVDSTDPVGVGEGLFSMQFYEDCFRLLTEDGVMINQHESPYYEGDALEMERAHKKLAAVFPVCRVYQFHMPTYASGHWLFGFASKKKDPLVFDEEAWNALGIETDYYNTKLHKGCFALPTYVQRRLNKAEGETIKKECE